AGHAIDARLPVGRVADASGAHIEAARAAIPGGRRWPAARRRPARRNNPEGRARLGLGGRIPGAAEEGREGEREPARESSGARPDEAIERSKRA
ncbi:MAG: hypothetical protein OEY14_16480, partial [Myxococcales bacterium]|nr:hypothetical protein [Myxococcales bacterium]